MKKKQKKELEEGAPGGGRQGEGGGAAGAAARETPPAIVELFDAAIRAAIPDEGEPGAPPEREPRPKGRGRASPQR